MNDNGEGPSGSQFHGILTHNSNLFIPTIPHSVETTTIGSPIDTPMDDRSKSDDVPSASDFECDSHYSETDDLEIPSPGHVSEAEDYDGRPISTKIDMGEAIVFCFPDNMEYDIDDQHHIFDDGVSGDESNYSDASTNYEELTEPDIVVIAVEVPVSDGGDEVESMDGDIDSEDAPDGDYECSSDDDDLYGDELGEALNNAVAGARQPSIMQVDVSSRNATPVPVSGSLYRLFKADLDLKKQEKVRDAQHWKLLELYEALRTIEREIPEVEKSFQEAEAFVIARQTDKLADIVELGLSFDLCQAYQDFCESLHAEFGLRDGFSITCDQPHNGSYFEYDPEFELFKEHVEMDYGACNFRCEASVKAGSWSVGGMEQVVEFWPIRCPEPLTGVETTWRAQYPQLYRLAIQAARSGSGTAMEMLMRLPTPDAPLSGWMFEYKFEPLLDDEPIISKRWVFSRAGNIDAPGTKEEKRVLLEELLAA